MQAIYKELIEQLHELTLSLFQIQMSKIVKINDYIAGAFNLKYRIIEDSFNPAWEIHQYIDTNDHVLFEDPICKEDSTIERNVQLINFVIEVLNTLNNKYKLTPMKSKVLINGKYYNKAVIESLHIMEPMEITEGVDLRQSSRKDREVYKIYEAFKVTRKT